MTTRLNQSVLAGGVVYPAGQEATDDLVARIPAKFWDEADPSDDGDEGEETTSYSSQSKADLQAEVDRRNEDRDPDGETYIVVGGKGNKPDLIAALEADDAVQG